MPKSLWGWALLFVFLLAGGTAVIVFTYGIYAILLGFVKSLNLDNIVLVVVGFIFAILFGYLIVRIWDR